MSKNSTLKLWNKILEHDIILLDELSLKITNSSNFQPRKEIINTIISYSKSVKVLNVGDNKTLISLN
tara:strand:- start:1084 stop:1284 length:201 start_codon:yes stop_codon:yes gene_type:complete